MVETLKILLREIKSSSIQDTFERYPSQIICLINEINFNSKCSSAISKGSSNL